MNSFTFLLLALPAWGAAPAAERADLRALRAGSEVDPLLHPGVPAGYSPRPVTGRAVFDEATAAAGGGIFFPRRSKPRPDALRFSAALVQTEGDAFTPVAVSARRHGLCALSLEGGVWSVDGAAPVLELRRPIFAPAKPGPGGTLVQLVAGESRLLVREADVVTVDCGRGFLRAYPPDRQSAALDAAEAVAAFEGLRDAGLLARWLASRGEDRGAAGLLVLGGLADLLGASASPVDYHVVRAALPPGWPRLAMEQEGRLFARALREAAAGVEDAETSVSQAPTLAALEALEAEVEGTVLKVNLLSKAFGLPRPEGLARAARKLRERAASRRAGLKRAGELSWESLVRGIGAEPVERRLLPPGLYSGWLREAGLEGPIAAAAEDPGMGLARKSLKIRRMIQEARLESGGATGRAILEAAAGGDWALAHGGAFRALSREGLAPVKDRWAALWSPAALGARKREGRELSPEETRLALIRLTPLDITGVILTRASRAPGRLEIAAACGGLASLFSGDPASPGDRYIVGPDALPLAAPMITGLEPVLSRERLEAVVSAARALDAHFGGGIELVFGFSGRRLVLVDARPTR